MIKRRRMERGEEGKRRGSGEMGEEKERVVKLRVKKGVGEGSDAVEE